MNFTITDVAFIAGSPTASDLPRSVISEIAVIGRSNVGKSTFVNRITGRKNIARVSGTPGRTQQLNVFKLTVKSEGFSGEISLVDLPGFGYAKFPKEQRERLSKEIVTYIRDRPNLRVVCVLNDCRRLPERDELAVRDMAFNSGRHVVVIATKLDKLTMKQQKKALKEMAKQYGLKEEDLVGSGKDVSAGVFWKRVMPLM